MRRAVLICALLQLTNYVVYGYIVGAGLNVRFAQMLYTDSKYQILREEMVKANTRNLVYHCRADASDCYAALAKMRYKASKHFYALSKAVVDYVKNKRQARPTGYVGKKTSCVMAANPHLASGVGYGLLTHSERTPVLSNRTVISGDYDDDPPVICLATVKGTATFCQDNICVPDTDPPIVYGGCYTLVSCGGNQTWHLDPVVNRKKKSRFFK